MTEANNNNSWSEEKPKISQGKRLLWLKEAIQSYQFSEGIKSKLIIAPRVSVFRRPSRYFWFIYYIPVFLWQCLKANLDVAYRVAHPKVPINPGIVKVKTSLKSEIGITFLANSITLTPGTLSVDVDKENGYIYVHWIDVKDKETEQATRIIVERFESILRRIFE